MPWYFWNDETIHAYEWIDSWLLDQLQVTLTYTPTSGIASFWQSEKTFDEMYIRINEMYKTRKFEFMQEKVDKMMADPLTKEIFITYGNHILAREHWWIKEQNPWNNQGCYQILYLQPLFNRCANAYDKWRRSVFSCSDVKRIYQNEKVLNQEEQTMQAMDFYMYLYDVMPSMEKRLMYDYNDAFSYRTNFLIWIKALLKSKYSDDELKKYIDAIITNDTNKIVELLNKESQAFALIWINDVEWFSKWKFYARTALIAGSYNGWNNNYGRAVNGKVYNMLDHAYVSNYPMYDIIFMKVGTDWWRRDTTDKQKWFMQTYFESMNDLNTWIEYASLLKVLKVNGDLRAAK